MQKQLIPPLREAVRFLDIEGLLIEQRGKLDEVYIEDWLTQFAEALAAPQPLSKYQELNQKIKDLGQSK